MTDSDDVLAGFLLSRDAARVERERFTRPPIDERTMAAYWLRQNSPLREAEPISRPPVPPAS